MDLNNRKKNHPPSPDGTIRDTLNITVVGIYYYHYFDFKRFTGYWHSVEAVTRSRSFSSTLTIIITQYHS